MVICIYIQYLGSGYCNQVGSGLVTQLGSYTLLYFIDDSSAIITTYGFTKESPDTGSPTSAGQETWVTTGLQLLTKPSIATALLHIQ